MALPHLPGKGYNTKLLFPGTYGSNGEATFR